VVSGGENTCRTDKQPSNHLPLAKMENKNVSSGTQTKEFEQ
jgi:hypothetical protein